MNTKPVQPHGGPVPERVPLPPTNRVILDEALRSQSRVVTRLPLLIVIVPAVVIAGLWGRALLAPVGGYPVSKLDERAAHDLSVFLRDAATNKHTSQELTSVKLRDAQGRAFWQAVCRQHKADYSVVSKLVSLMGEDQRADDDFVVLHGGELMDESCSFTGPRAGELANLLRGERCVLVTFNARNWNNYPDKGVIVILSDKEEAEWLEFEDAADDWGITAEEWADPAGKLFGKKAPFQHTYE